jgi:hypothetical protein
MPVSKTAAPSHEERVRARAHEIWVHEGYPDGRDLDHWRQAEAEIAAEGSPTDKRQRAAKATPAKAEEPKATKAKSGEAS